MDALELDTPALYVDLDVLERNVKRMQEQCRAWGVALRPHVKTHKTPEIAEMQLAAGAIGITVAKVGEAEVLPGDDVLVAYPLVKAKLPRLRELAKTRRVKVAVDSVEVARDVHGKGIETLVEIDVGVGRTVAQSPEQAVEIARACSGFRGIFYWPSWLDEAGFQAACAKIDAVLDALARAGFEAKIVSGGSTPGAAKTPLIPRTTEIRPGTYVFYDASSLAAIAFVRLGHRRLEGVVFRQPKSLPYLFRRKPCQPYGRRNAEKREQRMNHNGVRAWFLKVEFVR